MTTTSQDGRDKGTDGAVPEDKTQKPGQDARTVPLAEFIEMRQELRKALDKLSQMETSGDLTKQKSKPAAPQDSSADLAETVRDLQRREQMRSLAAGLQLNSEAQAEAVLKIMTTNSDLTPEEAKAIARTRSPEVFASGSEDSFNPAVHGTMRPRSADRAPEKAEKSDFKERVEFLSKAMAQNKDVYHKGLNNLIGSMAAKQVGRKHQLLPIQKKA